MYEAPRVFICFVGADSQHEKLGIASPLFSDGSFEYVPVLERAPLDPSCLHAVRYGDLKTRSGLPIVEFVSPKWLDHPAHYDPEFETFTYGDYVNKPRAAKLRRAEIGDFLFFLARLRPWKNGRFAGGPGHYVIGFIEIEKVLRGIPTSIRSGIIPAGLSEFSKNAHVRRCLCGLEDCSAWVFKGSSRSRLFDIAVPITPELATRIFGDLDLKSGRTLLQAVASRVRTCRLLDSDRSSAFLNHVEDYVGRIP